jgi:hypothetical protein
MGYHAIRAFAGKAWAVHKAGAKRSLRTGLCRRDAWTKAKRLARAKKTEAYLHGEDGRIKSRRDYTPL